ncbi:hypothetical protein MTO96_030067 [Rhipicephalus appendiculatus]
MCVEFQALAAWRDGVVSEIKQQLDEARRDAADLRVRVALRAVGPPGRSFSDVVAGRQEGCPPRRLFSVGRRVPVGHLPVSLVTPHPMIQDLVTYRLSSPSSRLSTSREHLIRM